MVRKTFFDDCRGERIQELLVSLSTLVLRKALTAGHGGRACIAAQLATAKSITAKEYRSFLPLAVAHRASLTALLQKKKDLRERYRNFGRTLDAKEKELDQRFEAVVSTQDILDRNSIPDHTVARISKLFEKNWQGDRKPVEVITQGEEEGVEDPLLDKPFSETWQEVSAGTFGGATGTSWQGLLRDLEERVANQEARLISWRKFREAMKREDRASLPADNTDSRKRQDSTLSPRKSPKKSDWKAGDRMNESPPTQPRRLKEGSTQDKLKERDLVFSPRKSPRKSVWPVERSRAETSPAHSPATLEQKDVDNIIIRDGDPDGRLGSPTGDHLFQKTPQKAITEFPTHIHTMEDGDESGFSEISNEQLHLNEPPERTVGIDSSSATQRSNPSGPSSTSNSKKGKTEKPRRRLSDIPGPLDHPDKLLTKGSTSDDDDSWISSLAVEGKQEGNIESQSPNEDDILAEQIVSMTINAAPTPANCKMSLMERTRRSMAFASPMGLQNLLPGGSSPTPLPSIPSKISHPSTEPGGPTTLLERTRQSISLVPSKPKGSRKSMLDRRTSKIYPTNQFETPKRQLERVMELTPPEKLFSPGAGYDSVFKSRPKIALSPTPSPRHSDDSENDAEVDDGMFGNGQQEASPLARMTAKV